MSNFMPWDRAPMGAGNMCDHGITMMRMNIKMGYEEYQDIIDNMYEWFEENQDKNTGLWGKLDAQGKNGLVQAGYHLMRGSYFYDKKEIKYIEKIIDTTEEMGGRVVIVSSEHDAGKQLKALGGVAGLLRFPIE